MRGVQGAPTTAVVPEIPIEKPNSSPGAVSEPFSSATCFQPLGDLVNTYTRPAPPAWPVAPTTAVAADIPTEMPNPSSPIVSLPELDDLSPAALRLSEHVCPTGTLGVKESAHYRSRA